MKSRLFCIIICLFTALSGLTAKEFRLTSPDGSIDITLSVGNQTTWSMYKDGKLLLAPSEISMSTDYAVYGRGKVKSVKTRRHSRIIDALGLYKRREVKDCCNEMVLSFSDCDLIFRAYDDGAAYRFVSKAKKPFKVLSERAEFRFPEDWSIYVPYTSKFESSFEKYYTHTEISEFDPRSMGLLPSMVNTGDNLKINIMESSLYNYPGMYLARGEDLLELCGKFAAYPDKVEHGGHNNLQGIVKSRRNYIAECGPAEKFPWRILAVGDDLAMADSDFVWRLADDPEDSDWSWVKPGKVAWEWWNNWNIRGVDFASGVNTATYKAYIDFAAKNKLEYVILDEGWAVKGAADLMQVVPAVDLEEIISYASEKNVGIILWAGYIAFDKDMENVCRHYSEMGVKGFKIDFMDRDDQLVVDFHRRAASMAAKYHLIVDFHGTYKPSGLNRTWPNVLNFEGVNGCEQMKWCKTDVNQPLYDVLIPFIRQCAGPMDYTQGAMHNAAKGRFRANYYEPMSMGTRCHQLAEYMIFDSPLCMLCDSPDNYEAEPECTAFIASVPTVWDDTRIVAGKVGEYIVTARRSGDVWYLGASTSWRPAKISVDIAFLGDGAWKAEIFRDGVNAERNGRDYIRETVNVLATDKLEMSLAPGGGCAAIFRKINN